MKSLCQVNSKAAPDIRDLAYLMSTLMTILDNQNTIEPVDIHADQRGIGQYMEVIFDLSLQSSFLEGGPQTNIVLSNPHFMSIGVRAMVVPAVSFRVVFLHQIL